MARSSLPDHLSAVGLLPRSDYFTAGRINKEKIFVNRFPNGLVVEDLHPERVFMYSKLAQSGIAAVSYLAAVSRDGRLSGSAEIAESREISRQLVAKILTVLSRAGLVEGTRGPTGGYRLARPAEKITLLDVVRVFENPEDRVMCPFGPNWCGHGPHCPLHDTFAEMHQKALDRLQEETFAQFVGT